MYTQKPSIIRLIGDKIMKNRRTRIHVKQLSQEVGIKSWEAKQIINRLKRSGRGASEVVNGYLVRLASDTRSVFIRPLHERERGQIGLLFAVVVLLLLLVIGMIVLSHASNGQPNVVGQAWQPLQNLWEGK